MNKNKLYPVRYALGGLIVYTLLFVLPGLIGIGYAFTDWSAYSTELNFVGLSNFKVIFSADENYLKIMGNTLQFTIVTTLAKNVIGLLLALLLVKGVKILNFHRGIMFMPSIISTLIIGMIFTSILNPATGLLNTFFTSMGLDFMAQQWLTSLEWAFPSVMAVDIWKGTGYIMTILTAGILSIPSDYFEAADIDGASTFQRFRYITLPLLLPVLTTTTLLNVIYGLKVFDIVYALTNGGPGKATTEVLYTIVFKNFGYGFYAVSTALSSIMFLFMLFVGYFIIRVMQKEVD